MPFRTWVFAVAFGLIASLGQAQENVVPSLENDPVGTAGYSESAEGADDQSECEQADGFDYAPALTLIEGAIRDLVADVDHVEAQRQQENEERDLQAQEDMAYWAKLMFWASAVTVGLTFIALVAIIRTLKHTKTAAEAAVDMVEEAKGTTLATRQMAEDSKAIGDSQVQASIDAVATARSANEVAAKQFRAGFKPWISVEIRGPFIDMRGENPIRAFADGETHRMVALHASTFIHCVGDIPATIEDFDLRLIEGQDWPYVENPPPGFGAVPADFFTILPSKNTIQICPRLGITNHAMSFNGITLTPENRSNFMMHPPPVVGKIIYSDPMGFRYEHRFAFVAYPTWGDSFKRYGGREYNVEREIT